jgi:DNA-binding MurR/RpiR family transcriptional regulator
VTWLGVSAPTITRFSRAIGCDGLYYAELNLKVMSSLRVGMRYLEPLTPPDTLAEVQERVVLRAQRAVLAARKTIDVVMLDRVIDALTRSHMIYAFGSGGVSSGWSKRFTTGCSGSAFASPAAAITRCR